MKKDKNFPTLLCTLPEFSFVIGVIFNSFIGNKKCRNAYLSSIPAQYPERDLNPHKHYCLLDFKSIPISFQTCKSSFSNLHFEANHDISAPHFRTFSALYFSQVFIRIFNQKNLKMDVGLTFGREVHVNRNVTDLESSNYSFTDEL